MTQKFLIRCINNDEWFRGYDPFGDPPGVMPYRTGKAVFTRDPLQAKMFDTAAAAHEFWLQTHPTVRTRPDGRPNRPLTAYTVEIVPVEMSAA